MEKNPDAQPRCIEAIKGDNPGYFDMWEARFHAYTPGTLFQFRCQQNIYLRGCWRYYKVVDTWHRIGQS